MAKGYNRPRPQKGAGMMAQIQQMQQQMEQAQAELADEPITATIGGGVISITMTGDQVCRSITISPELFEDPDIEMIQDLITSAVNTALEKSQKLASEKMAPFTSMLGGMGLGM